MKFWDASALTPLLLCDRFTTRAEEVAGSDREMAVWWASRVECASAIARLERDGRLHAREAEVAWDRLRQAARWWHEVEPGEQIRDAALRILRVHPLRAGDALQLAAAWATARVREATLEFVTFDERLAQAARKEGFRVLGND